MEGREFLVVPIVKDENGEEIALRKKAKLTIGTSVHQVAYATRGDFAEYKAVAVYAVEFYGRIGFGLEDPAESESLFDPIKRYFT